jgi:integrase
LAKVHLPRYVRKRRLKDGREAYFWELPSWARPPAERFGRQCPAKSEALGTYVADAHRRGDILNTILDEWRAGVGNDAPEGTVKALFLWYRTQPRFKEAAFLTRRDYGRWMDDAAALPLKTKLFGEMQADSITAAHADTAYRLAIKHHGKRGGAGCMQACRRVWNEAIRHRKVSAKVNPFSKMGIKIAAEKGNRATTRAEYDAFRAKAREMGYQNMATAAAITFELVRRVDDVFGYVREPLDMEDGFFWAGYKPGVEIAMRQGKTGTEQVIPLADENGEPLYTALEEELARTPRIGDHIVLNDKGERFDEFEALRLFKKIRDAAGLPKTMTPTGFRHGGATELGDAGIVDIRPISGHKTLAQTLTYNKATEGKARAAGQQRRAHVTRNKP